MNHPIVGQTVVLFDCRTVFGFYFGNRMQLTLLLLLLSFLLHIRMKILLFMTSDYLFNPHHRSMLNDKLNIILISYKKSYGARNTSSHKDFYHKTHVTV